MYKGRFKTHYPYWDIKVNHNGEKRDWKNIPQGSMRDLLREVGYTEERIEAFEYAVELRHHIYRLQNYLMITLKHLGLIEESDIVERS